MPKEISAGFVPIVDFVGRVSELLQQIDPLSTTVERYAKESAEIRELVRHRDQRQNEFEAALSLSAESRQDVVDSTKRMRDDLDAEIERRYRPFDAVDKEVRTFASSVREILDYLPADRPALQPIRFEIERLALWQMVADRFPIRMRDVLGELKKVRIRLCEILEECNRGTARTSGLSQRERRRQIVDTLQTKIHVKGREGLARYLHVHDSSIHAAIRGDRGHSGPSTEQLILEACRTHHVDCRGWI